MIITTIIITKAVAAVVLVAEHLIPAVVKKLVIGSDRLVNNCFWVWWLMRRESVRRG